MFRWLLATVFLDVVLLAPAVLAQKWTVQYFYDQDRTELQLTDLAFPTSERGIAIGTIYEREGKKPKYTALVTSDGGINWALVPLKEFPRSIFFLDELNGWLVTSEGIWHTAEAGRSWTRIGDQIKPNRKLDSPPPGGLILRVWFLDAQHGFAAGFQKSAFETHDGGRTWTPVEEAAKPPSNPAYSLYTHLGFADTKHGLIVGGYSPPRKDADLPDWMEPEKAMRRRPVPTLTLELETRDGGVTWASSTAPLIGSVASLRVSESLGLAVFGYADSFEWPSEVYGLNLATGKSESVFKQKDRRVTDAISFPGTRAFLAAVEPSGRLHSSPIPGKVKVLTSANLKDWTEMDVDYRAVARSLVLAGPDAGHLWAATDTGMILRLSP
jgi:photosystem II stability/assembly factor-like uncharacterized protein